MTITYDRRTPPADVLLVATDPAAMTRARRISDACDLDVRQAMLIGDLPDDQDVVSGAALCLVELGDATDAGATAADATVARVLAGIDAAAARGSIRAIVAFGADAIDPVTAAMPSGATDLLCQASDTDRIAAVRLALARPRHGVAEDGDDDAAQLRATSEELERLARLLAGMADRRLPATLPVAAPVIPGGSPVRAEDVRRLIRQRRLREQFLPAALFADPAWDILLDLAAARLERHAVAVSSLCIAAAVPPTTALRWIRMLTEQGLLVRDPDPSDGRRVFMSLSDACADAVLRYVAAVRQMDQPAP